MKVVFRVDASLQMGTGHVMRCLTLANELKQQNHEIVFICRELTGNLILLIKCCNHIAKLFIQHIRCVQVLRHC